MHLFPRPGECFPIPEMKVKFEFFSELSQIWASRNNHGDGEEWNLAQGSSKSKTRVGNINLDKLGLDRNKKEIKTVQTFSSYIWEGSDY